MESLLVTRPNYEPRAQVSPSRFKLSRICERLDGWRYIAGIKEREHAWDAIKDVPKPEYHGAPKDKVAKKAHTEEIKAWNRARRGPLGKRGHEILEAWYASFKVGAPPFDKELWKTEPGRIMLAGLHYLPHPSHLHSWITEHKIPDSFVHEISDGRFSYEFNAYLDLLATLRNPTRYGYETVQDYKTTSSFDWAMKPAELLEDPQGIVYPLYAMHRKRTGPIVGGQNANEIVARWTYFRTEDTPLARPVDFLVQYEGAKRRALKLFEEGQVLVNRCIDRADPMDLPANVSACENIFHRPCIYHHSQGGPCKTDSTPGQRLRASLNDPKRREKIIMSFKEKRAAAGGGAAKKESPASTGAEAAGSEGAVDAGGVSEAAGSADSTSETAPKRGYNRRGKAGAASEGMGAASVSFADGSGFDVPEGSPIHTRLVAARSALFGE